METAHENHAKLIESYHKLNLPSISDKGTWVAFNQLSNMIVRRDVMDTTNAVLAVLLPNDAVSEARRARVFLSAYCLATHDDELLADTPKEFKKVNVVSWASRSAST
jgi:hypothetical protein